MKTKIESGIVIYQMQFGLPKYLLVHLRNWEWGFPKRVVDFDEQPSLSSLRTTAVRAVKQQTNLSVQVTSRFHKKVDYRPYRRHPRQVTFFISKVKPHVIVTPPKQEVMDYGWFDYRTAYRTLYYDNLRDVLFNVNRQIRGL